MKKNNYICLICLIIISIIICFGSTLSPISNEYIGVDSSVFIYTAKQMLNNKVPYLDVFDHKGPLLYVINALGLIIGNNNVLGIWILETVAVCLTLVFLFKIAFKITNNHAKSMLATLLSAITLTVFFDEGNLTEEFALPFITISLYIFVLFILDSTLINKRNIFFTGLFFGAVLLLRPNMISVWLVYYPLLAIKLLKEKEYKKLWQLFIYSIIGVITLVLPFVLYLIYKSAWKDFIYSYLIFNFNYTSIGDKTLIEVIKFFLSKNKIFYIAFLSIFIFTNKKKENAWIYLASILFLLISFYLVVMQKLSYLHYAIVLTPSVIIPFSRLIKYIESKHLIYAFIVLVSLSLSERVLNEIEKVISKDDKPYIEISNYIKENTTDNDKILVLGNKCLIYLLSNRDSSSKYPYQVPISNIDKKIEEEIITDLDKCDSNLIVIFSLINPNIENKLSQLINKEKYTISNQYEFILLKKGDK